MRIDRFAVPPEDDAAFLADWDAVAAGGILLRAVRPDAPVRFVSLAASGAGEPYELVREAGDPDLEGGVVLLARYRPEPGTNYSEEFVPAWDAQRAVLAGRRGHIGARLYRGAEDFVEVARWSSPLMLQRAEQDPEVGTLPGLVDAAVYQVLRR